MADAQHVPETPREIAQRVARALTATLAISPTDSLNSKVPPQPVAPVTTHQHAGTASPTASPTPPPAQATAYVAMLPFAYTNSDVAQLFSPFGKIARVTILRDKQTRKSRGVAFVQFARADDCAAAVAEMHEAKLEGFQLSCSVVKDNGRAHEFQRKRKYASSAAAPGTVIRCFECGEYGHFSYDCPRNVLGARERPVQNKKLKKKKTKGYDVRERGHYFNDDGVVNMLAPPADGEEDVSLTLLSYPSLPSNPSENGVPRDQARKRRAVGNYFSDESASDVTQATIVWSAAMFAASPTTNNTAEYAGSLQARAAHTQKWLPLDVVGDSQFILRQLRVYKPPKKDHLRELYDEARRLGAKLEVRKLIHHLQSHNKMTNAAANLAMTRSLAVKSCTRPTGQTMLPCRSI